jgi:hypothetical protein
MSKSAYAHIEAAVAEVLPTITPEELRRHRPAGIVAARLYAYIDAATTHLLPDAASEEINPDAGAADKRAKPWQLQIRFWQGDELVGETDPEVITGTGQIAEAVATVAADLHGETPSELGPDAVKKLLPQLRNNLARQAAAVMRIKYTAADIDEDPVFAGREMEYLCQIDVFRLS